MDQFEYFSAVLDCVYAVLERPRPFSQVEQDYESRTEAEREGAPRFCGTCQHYHEEVDGDCPYMEGLGGPML